MGGLLFTEHPVSAPETIPGTKSTLAALGSPIQSTTFGETNTRKDIALGSPTHRSWGAGRNGSISSKTLLQLVTIFGFKRYLPVLIFVYDSAFFLEGLRWVGLKSNQGSGTVFCSRTQAGDASRILCSSKCESFWGPMRAVPVTYNPNRGW